MSNKYISDEATKPSLRKEKTLELKEGAEDDTPKTTIKKRKTHEISVYDTDTDTSKKGLTSSVIMI